LITDGIPLRVIFIFLMLVPSTTFAADSVGVQSQPQADYVGAATCRQCHESEFKAWTGSHHQLAMQEANATSVLGDFNTTKFKHYDIESTFFKRDGKFMVRTDGADGKLADFEISYVFGVWPLQQYLIAFPGGRYQVLGIAWDARTRSEGGQRWFHIYANERSITRTSCIGRGCIKTGIWNAQSVTRPISGRVMTPPAIPTRPHSARSTWRAKLATARARAISNGQSRLARITRRTVTWVW
jgi:hypothetical protein